MSFIRQPSPVLPNYNPSAWDTPLSAEEQEILNAYYVKYPTAQNAPITFPSTITTSGVTTTTLNSLGTVTLSTNAGNTTTVGKLVIPPLTYTATQFPFNVVAPSEYGAKFYPENGLGNKGNIVFGGCFPTSDTRPRRIADIYAGFTGFDWGASYMSLAVGNGGVSNEGNLPTLEQMRISQSTITMNKPITPAYTSAPTSGQIGFIINGTVITTSETNAGPLNATRTLGSVAIPSAGVWCVSFSIQYTFTGTAFNQPVLSIPSATPTVGTNQPTSPLIGNAGYFATSSAYTFYAPSALTAFINILYSTGTVGSGFGYMNAVRIA